MTLEERWVALGRPSLEALEMRVREAQALCLMQKDPLMREKCLEAVHDYLRLMCHVDDHEIVREAKTHLAVANKAVQALKRILRDGEEIVITRHKTRYNMVDAPLDGVGASPNLALPRRHFSDEEILAAASDKDARKALLSKAKTVSKGLSRVREIQSLVQEVGRVCLEGITITLRKGDAELEDSRTVRHLDAECRARLELVRNGRDVHWTGNDYLIYFEGKITREASIG